MKIIDRVTLWEGRFLRTCLTTYLARDGCRYEWECYERTSKGVVIIVPVLPNERVLLIRQFRPPVGETVLELPAGLIDPGETPETTAARELVEETGYSPGVLSPLIAGPYSPALTSGTLDVFLASNLHYVGKTGGDRNEHIETLEVSFSSAFEDITRLVSRGEKVDLKILGFIELARRTMGY